MLRFLKKCKINKRPTKIKKLVIGRFNYDMKYEIKKTPKNNNKKQPLKSTSHSNFFSTSNCKFSAK